MYQPKPLKYNYNGLEPLIDGETLKLHYEGYYLNYLKKLNTLLEKLNFDFRYTIEELPNHIDEFPLSERGEILYLVGGVQNHELYFDSINNVENIPNGKILTAIQNQYGTYDNFKNEFKKIAQTLVGSGYTFLVITPNNQLDIINTSNQETPILYGLKPILGIDLWEHAYLLKYHNKKDNYVDSFFKIIDFKALNQRYEKELQKI